MRGQTTRLPNLRHLRVLHQVVLRGKVSAAARALHLSQPAASQGLRQLESELGVRLVERVPTGVRPTQAALTIIPRVGRSLEQIREGLAGAAPWRGRQEVERLLSRITSAEVAALAALVEHRGFAKAAAALSVSRPTLHRAARTLERTLGVPLFERTSFGLSPTREADHLARHARLALAEIEQGRAELCASRGTERGGTVIGAMPLARSGLVPSAVLEFSARYPQHRVSILDGPYDALLAALRNGGADVLVGALRDPLAATDVVQEHLFDDPLALIMRADHPLAHRARVRVRELRRFAWIAPRAGSPLRRQFDQLLGRTALQSGARPAQAIECNSLVAARAMLLGSDRLMLLSRYQIQHELAAGVLAALPHPSGNVVRSIGLTLRKDWQPTAAQRVLLDGLRGRARNAALSFSARGRAA